MLNTLPIITERLILRRWQESDLEPFAKLNADPRVRQYFPSLLSAEESNQMANKMDNEILERGWGWWAASVRDSGDFIGFIGLNEVDTQSLPFAPAVEIGWRLAYEFWGKGYATEGALHALKYGFDVLNLEEIVSFTALPNQKSMQVMQRIGMHRDVEFDHPKLPEGHALRRHILYRLKKNEWHGI